DLARPPGPRDGRHPLPDPDRFAARLGEWGIERGTTVVAYDDAGGAVAARLWWLLRWLGHERVAVLNGGFPRWRASGLPVESTIPRWEPRRYSGYTVNADWVVGADEIPEAQRAGALLVDVRAAARYRGEREPIDPVAGHVPGAVTRPFDANLAADGRLAEPAGLRAELEALAGGRPSRDVMAMCGSGVTACHLLLAMEHAGLGIGRLYAGSRSEWIRDPARPVGVGDEPQRRP